jgi:DNA-binding NarL/FixJ family response regulator
MCRIRVLLVESSDHWRQNMRRMLEEESGIQVVCEVSDGLKAVRMAEQLQPDVVLLDIGLPGINGIEACGWICHVAPRAKSIFLTERSEGHIVHAAISHRAWGYILKSNADRELIPAIRSVSNGRKFVSNQIATPDDINPEA